MNWYQVGATPAMAILSRYPDGIIAVNPKNGALLWRNTAICIRASYAAQVAGRLYLACSGSLSVLDPHTGNAVRTIPLGMDGVNTISAIADDAIAVEGFSDGAALRNQIVLLRPATLVSFTDANLTDSTLLGVIGDRIYIDDWCCNGRADEYLPATVYSISLKDGTQSVPVDLRPDPQLHPARMQPLGQGERNSLVGRDLYVPVGDVTYKYDILNLSQPPVRIPNPQ